MRFPVRTDNRLDVVDITDDVAGALPNDADTGTATVFVEHTTAGIVVNEAESNLLADVRRLLSALVPDDGWDHDRLDDNADAHLRTLLLGSSVTVPVDDGDLAVGRWQSVLLVDCDGPRERSVRVVYTNASTAR
jgi:secondary thiamine-phosphate synthase enzyme